MKRLKSIKIRKLVLTFLLLIALSAGFVADASSPYKAYTTAGVSGNEFVGSQLPFLPAYTISKFGDLELNDPQDIYVDREKSLLYIADKGNARVIVSDLEGNLVRTIGEGLLKEPWGVTVGKSGSVYVADKTAGEGQTANVQNGCVFKFAEDGTLLHRYERPTEPLYGEGIAYKPVKVETDIAENLYVICDGNYNGMVQLSNSGSFLGYFGANKTSSTFADLLRKTFYSEEQLAQYAKKQPKTPSNVSTDKDGLAYTITKGLEQDGLKKLNMAGSNLLEHGYADTTAQDVTVGNHGNIYIVSAEGYIFEYSNDGYLLFIFGGRDDANAREGLFENATGIAADQNENLYVLDSKLKLVQVFTPTEFQNNVYTAFDLYSDGHYADSKEPWETVLKSNRTFAFAYRGLGEAEFMLNNFDEALENYKLGGDHAGYSDAFWEIRNTWLKSNIIYVLLILLAVWLVTFIVKKTNRKFGYLAPVQGQVERFKNLKLIRELRFISRFVKNPADGYYGIRFEHKTSVLSATIYYLLFFVIYVVQKYFSGFIFNYSSGYYNLPFDFTLVFVIIMFVVICNYLVSTIRDGEGSFKVVYMSLAYSLMPFLLLRPLVFVLTHVLTLNESFLIYLVNTVAILWFVVLLIDMLKEIHNYTFKQVFLNIFLTFFTMFIMVLVLFVIFLMLNQLLDFGVSIWGEVVYRFGA